MHGAIEKNNKKSGRLVGLLVEEIINTMVTGTEAEIYGRCTVMQEVCLKLMSQY
jgi:hypothetical protein